LTKKKKLRLGFLDRWRWYRFAVPERRCNNYCYTLRNNIEERRSQEKCSWPAWWPSRAMRLISAIWRNLNLKSSKHRLDTRLKIKSSTPDLLDCDAAPLAKWFPTFRKNVLPSSSRVQCSWPHIPEDLNLQLYCRKISKFAKINLK
jgi:hypothetical protein